MDAAPETPTFGGDTTGIFIVESLQLRSLDVHFVCEPILIRSEDAVVDHKFYEDADEGSPIRIRIGSRARDAVTYFSGEKVRELRDAGVTSLQLEGNLEERSLSIFNLERLIPLLSNQVGDWKTVFQSLPVLGPEAYVPLEEMRLENLRIASIQRSHGAELRLKIYEGYLRSALVQREQDDIKLQEDIVQRQNFVEQVCLACKGGPSTGTGVRRWMLLHELPVFALYKARRISIDLQAVRQPGNEAFTGIIT